MYGLVVFSLRIQKNDTPEAPSTPGTVFVSGDLDLRGDEFEAQYALRLYLAHQAGATFVVGDAEGCDTMAQAFLKKLGATVTVFHMFEAPRNNVGPFGVRGGFQTDEERDQAMTEASDGDIAWVRPGREDSGTAKNLARRLKSSCHTP